MRRNLSLFMVFVLVSLFFMVLAVQAQTLCPSACTCMLPSDAAKMKGYSLCGGKQVLCGYDKAQNPQYCYQKPAPATTTPVQYSKTVAITTTPSPIPYSKPIVPTTTPGEVYSQTLCPEHCSCVGKDMICYERIAETFDVTPTPRQFGKPEVTTTPDEVYPQTLITCPETCTCMVESSARAQGRSSCGVPVWAGGCVGLACDWCGDQDGEDMYCFSNITREAVPGISKPSQNILPPAIAPTGLKSLTTTTTTAPRLPAPPDTGETAESPGGLVIPLGLHSVIGAIGIVIIGIGLFSTKKA